MVNANAGVRTSAERPDLSTAPRKRLSGSGIMAGRAYCSDMLPKVSRTFALCIRLLPADLEHPVLLAYLLCRIADTIEDAADLSGSDKE